MTECVCRSCTASAPPPQILVMELLDGVPLGQAEPLIAERDLDRQELARTLLRCLLRQLMTDGVFLLTRILGTFCCLPMGSSPCWISALLVTSTRNCLVLFARVRWRRGARGLR